jgi:hypothetical protein
MPGLYTELALRYRTYGTVLHRIELKFSSICTSDCLNFCTAFLYPEAKPSLA